MSNTNVERMTGRVGLAFLPLFGMLAVVVIWAIASASFAPSLPSPAKTWETSRPYIVEPFEKRGELDQGILRFTWYSLTRVAKGYALALLFGVPIGLLLGVSRLFKASFDPIIQILRPVSPLAWLPLAWPSPGYRLTGGRCGIEIPHRVGGRVQA